MRSIIVMLVYIGLYGNHSLVFGQDSFGLNVSINGTLSQHESNYDPLVRISGNGRYRCTYKINAVTDEYRKISDLAFLSSDGKIMYRLSSVPGSDMDISNAGYLLVYDHTYHPQGKLILHVFSPGGTEILSKEITGMSACNLSDEGHVIGIRNPDGYTLIDLRYNRTVRLPIGYAIDISERSGYTAIIEPYQLKLYKDYELVRLLDLTSASPRDVCILADQNALAWIDKRNLTVISLDNFRTLHTDRLSGDESFKDLQYINNRLVAGIHRRNMRVSQGIMKSYAFPGFETTIREGKTRTIENPKGIQRRAKTTGLMDPIPWPFIPFDSTHTVWNHYEQHMSYGTPDFSYLHQGLDMIIPIGEPTYAVKEGIVKCVLTIGGAVYWRIAISDTQTAGYSNGWLYAHLIESTIQFSVGDTVQLHDYIGDIVEWTSEWGHIHFVNIRDSGTVWLYNDNEWGINFNPLLVLEPVQDSHAPVIAPVFENSTFAFCLNETSTYLNPDSLYGNVDLIVKVADTIGHSPWQQPAFKTEYWIRRLSDQQIVVPARLGHILNHPYPMYNSSAYEPYALVMYKRDSILVPSSWMDEERNYYHVLTNSDGDDVLELDEKDSSLCTANFQDGWYRVYVRVYDPSGNTSQDSMDVRIRNNPVSIDDDHVNIPVKNALYQNYPNPFNPSSVIKYNVSRKGRVSLIIYNSLGQEVRTLVNGIQTAGTNQSVWDGNDKHGKAVSSGVYIYRITMDGFTQSRKMILLR